jgi:HEAT repeat protein
MMLSFFDAAGVPNLALIGPRICVMRWLLLILVLAISTRIGFYVLVERTPAVPSEIAERISKLKKAPNAADRSIAAQWLAKNGGAHAVEPLTRAIHDPDGIVRQAAAWGLGEIGPTAISAASALWIAVEQDDDEFVRLRSAKAIVALGPAASPMLVAGLRSGNEKARAATVRALESSVDASRALLPDLIGLLGDPDLSLRKDAAAVLSTLGPAAADAIPALVHAMRQETAQCPQFAEALREIGPTSVPAVTALLEDSNPHARIAAIATLSEFGSKAVSAWPKLTSLFADPDDTVRELAIRAAPRIAPTPVETLPPLLAAMQDPAAGVRRSAAEAIGELGADGAAGVPAILEEMAASEPETKSTLIEALGKIGPPAKAAVPVLLQTYSSGDAQLETVSAKALGRIGPDAEIALPALIAALDKSLTSTGDDPGQIYVNVELVEAIGKIGAAQPERVIPVMRRALATKDEWTRIGTLQALANLDPAGDEVVTALISHLYSENHEVAEAAAAALARCGKGSKLTLPALVEAIQSPRYNGRRQSIADPLATFGAAAKDAVPALISGLADAGGWDEESRIAAAHALAVIDPSSQVARDALSKELVDPLAPEKLRVAAAEALIAFAATYPEIIVLLDEVESDSNGPVRVATTKALRKLGVNEVAPAP